MRFRRRARSGDDDAESVNIISLLDVVLNLLFFFMVGATFEKSAAMLKVNLPQVGEAKRAEGPPPDTVIRIGITAGGEFFLNGAAQDRADLLASLQRLSAESPGRTILVEADANAVVQDAVTVLDLCRRAGFREVQQVVREAPRASPLPRP